MFDEIIGTYVSVSSVKTTEVAISKDDRLPPTHKGGGWVLTTPTKKEK